MDKYPPPPLLQSYRVSYITSYESERYGLMGLYVPYPRLNEKKSKLFYVRVLILCYIMSIV